MRPDRVGQSRRAILAVVKISALVLILQVAGGALGWWPLALDIESLTFLAIMVLFLALGPLILWKVGNRTLCPVSVGPTLTVTKPASPGVGTREGT